jgi:NAD(P)-dependent dehydrogenase (short-subunit alcohol dehydrogenase family)
MSQHLSGKVAVVTGASSGIGVEIARGLASKGARVGMVCRDRARSEPVREAVAAETGQPVDLFLADLSSLAQVRRVAAELLAAYPRLDVLVNNAGAVFGRKTMSVDGIEMSFALNHLAAFLLTDLLLPRLRASPAARIVVVSSAAHRMGRMDLENLRGEDGYGAMRMYARSKLANVLFTRELARRLDGSPILVNCLHPGVVATRFGETGGPITSLFYRIGSLFMRKAARGADTAVWLANSPEVTGSGGYYFDRREAYTSAEARDLELARRLWRVSEELVAR